MRMRLKYVIGGALVALATLAAPGPANAVLITEPAGVESGVLNGVMNVGGLIPLGVLVDTGGLGSGVATPAGSGMNIINAGCNTTGTPLGEPCGDTVVVTAGAVAGTVNLAWTSGINDMIDIVETENFQTLAGVAVASNNPATGAGLSITTVSDTPVPTPEPATLALLGSALVGFGLIRRRRKA